MALDIQKLTPHDAATKGRKIWTYFTSADNKAAVKGANYFNGAANMFETGDTITITASDAVFDAQISISGSTVTISAKDAFA